MYEKSNRAMTGITIPQELLARVDRLAEEHEISRSRMITMLIRDSISRYEQEDED